MRQLRQHGASFRCGQGPHELRQLSAAIRRQHLRQRHRPPHGQRPSGHEEPRRHPALSGRTGGARHAKECEKSASADGKGRPGGRQTRQRLQSHAGEGSQIGREREEASGQRSPAHGEILLLVDDDGHTARVHVGHDLTQRFARPLRSESQILRSGQPEPRHEQDQNAHQRRLQKSSAAEEEVDEQGRIDPVSHKSFDRL